MKLTNKQKEILKEAGFEIGEIKTFSGANNNDPEWQCRDIEKDSLVIVLHEEVYVDTNVKNNLLTIQGQQSSIHIHKTGGVSINVH